MVTFSAFPASQTGSYARISAQVRRCETMGFETAYFADETPMAFDGATGSEAWSLMAALARDTTRIRLGTFVSPMTARHPLLLAMAATTVDQVSGGRVVVGVGAGGGTSDLAGFGLPAQEPAALIGRLDEGLGILDRLLRGETVDHEGTYFTTHGAWVSRPIQQPRPPLLVAAQAAASIHVAARYSDVWNSLGGQPAYGDRVTFEEAVARTRRQVERLGEACAELGRDPSTLRRSVFAYRARALDSDEALADWVGRYTELGFDEIVLVVPDPEAGVEADAAEATRLTVLERFVASRVAT